jgi:hypothetical protein
MHTRISLITSSLLLVIILVSCNLSSPEESTPDLVATSVAATLTALEVVPLPSSTPDLAVIVTSTLVSTATETARPTTIPQNPLVLETILCWKGPGAQFEVVSALKKDTRVELIGRASISGWWIVDNPIYHDACWAQAEYLQIEAGFNTAALPIFTPPPTPTFTPTNTRTPTATNTP